MPDQDIPSDMPIPDADWEALARFAAGEGSAEERLAVEQRLSREPALASLIGALDAARPPAPAAPSSREVESALASVLARRETASRTAAPAVSLDAYRSRWRSARLQAAAAVLLVAGVGLVWRATSSGEAPAAPASASQFATAVGTVDSLRLPDGTQVLLGPGSTLTVAAGFGGTSRDVTLTGHARFDVVHDTARPFVVHTAAASFRDVGTVFGVNGDSTNGSRITVTEGAVAILARGAADSVVLYAGDRAAVGRTGSVRVERQVATADDLAWTTGRLVMRDASVEQLIADVRRWYGMDLRVDSALAGHKVNVAFERGAAPRDVARIVAALLGGGVREEAGSMRIVAPAGVSPQR